jgi:hypothetical protein
VIIPPEPRGTAPIGDKTGMILRKTVLIMGGPD